ncbi:VOC family protein [Fibrella sp. HMF5335]|uniref:VOC family protein n=1 Tax=Fibrella rubiginis TaxID=2817060 RepID=A0A939GFN4_9BACT|nr:VOC family protein [Fibrella rubiginis]MBO0938119.1 VOC family protein [Fibrella rubiginis]
MKQLFTGLLIFTILQVSAHVTQGQTRLGVVRCNYVALSVKDLTASLPFYSNVLGLNVVAVPAALAASQAWFDVGGGQQIRLVEGRSETNSAKSENTSISLMVSSLRLAEQQLRQRNVSVSRQNGPSGKPILLVNDPDGYQIELSEGKIKTESPGFLQSAAKTLWKSITTVE